jgi:hypothetical protein
MRVPMVFVVRMPVFVLDAFMPVLMLVTFRKVQPQADGHKPTCCHQPNCQRFIEQRHRQ